MLLDTSGLLCFLDASETRHSDAAAYFEAASLRVTTNYVLAEFVALCQARRYDRRASLAFVTELANNPLVEVVWVDAPLHARAMGLLESRPDKAWSLCDAVSLVLMEQCGITDALTTDHHFEQAGFRALLRASERR